MRSLSDRDQQYVWHPFTQVRTELPPLPVVRGEGALLFTEDGRAYIDGISSWWVTLHGHANPYIADRIAEQARTLEQVIFAGFTHPGAIQLAERLLKLLSPGFHKVFFSDDGSTSVEVALKMALQFWHNKNEPRTKIVAFEGAYHGDTFGAMSVGARGVFNRPFESLLFEVIAIPVPVAGREQQSLAALEHALSGNDVAAFIFEPLVQGAAGMVMYDAEPLEALLNCCKKYGVLSIADEVMTGFGRTGCTFAIYELRTNLRPDIICLSKGLTGGFLPMGLTACAQHVFDAFISEDRMRTFFHGHSYTANPLACAAANASLDLLERSSAGKAITRLTAANITFVQNLRPQLRSTSLRAKGTILAVEFHSPEGASYFNELGKHAYRFFLDHGILLRPLGNVIYVMPPYCITPEQHAAILGTLEAFIWLVEHERIPLELASK